MFEILQGDALAVLRTLPDESVHCCVTSPPYWGLRDYGVAGQLGLEKTPEQYVSAMVDVFCEVRRVLRADGTLWVNLGDSYCAKTPPVKIAPIPGVPGGFVAGGAYDRGERGFFDPMESTDPRRWGNLKPKDLVGIPWMVAFALRADGWYLRSDIIWHKPNPMPESVTDRPTKAHEYIFLLSKSERYRYDAGAIREPSVELERPQSEKRRAMRMSRGVVSVDGLGQSSKGVDGGAIVTHVMHTNPAGRNKRTVWTVSTCPTPEAHFATYPPDLIEPCILAGCPEGGTVLDPFSGAGTTGLACLKHGRQFLGIELNPEYIGIAMQRASKYYPLLVGATA